VKSAFEIKGIEGLSGGCAKIPSGLLNITLLQDAAPIKKIA
jgi:hypothetical protein